GLVGLGGWVFRQRDVVQKVLATGAGPVRAELHRRLVVAGVGAVGPDRMERVEAPERPLLTQGVAVLIGVRRGRGRGQQTERDDRHYRKSLHHPSRMQRTLAPCAPWL